jgi:hypothetical protein
MTPHEVEALDDEDFAAMVRLMQTEAAEVEKLSKGR